MVAYWNSSDVVQMPLDCDGSLQGFVMVKLWRSLGGLFDRYLQFVPRNWNRWHQFAWLSLEDFCQPLFLLDGVLAEARRRIWDLTGAACRDVSCLAVRVKRPRAAFIAILKHLSDLNQGRFTENYQTNCFLKSVDNIFWKLSGTDQNKYVTWAKLIF